MSVRSNIHKAVLARDLAHLKPTTAFKWTRGDKLPAPRSKVWVFTVDGKQALGIFLCDDNWQMRGYSYDLFNSNIMCWKYL